MTGAAAAVLRCPRMLVTNDTHTYLGPQSAALGSGRSAIGLGLDELAGRQSLRVHVYIPRISDASTLTLVFIVSSQRHLLLLLHTFIIKEYTYFNFKSVCGAALTTEVIGR